MDESVRRFVERHAVGAREAALTDVEPWLGWSPEALSPIVRSACRLAAAAVFASPDRDDILDRRDPPHEGWDQLRARFRTP